MIFNFAHSDQSRTKRDAVALSFLRVSSRWIISFRLLSHHDNRDNLNNELKPWIKQTPSTPTSQKKYSKLDIALASKYHAQVQTQVPGPRGCQQTLINLITDLLFSR